MSVNEQTEVGNEIAEETLRAIERQLEVLSPLLDKTADGLLLLAPGNPEPSIVFTSNAFCRIAGAPQRELRGKRLSEILLEGADGTMRLQISAGLAHSGACRILRPDGTTTDVEVSLIPVPDSSARTSHWITLVRAFPIKPDASGASRDELTGLPNRAFLLREVGNAVDRSLGTDTSFALLQLDIDRFREINDIYGHDVGDAMLSTAAKRILEVVRQTDVTARLGGDEFGMLLAGVGDEANADFVATKIIRTLEEPFEIEGEEETSLSLAASIGIAMFPSHGRDATELIRSADIAMYEAKRSGRHISVYSPGQETDSAGQLARETELRHAIENEELVQYYQPLLDLKTGEIYRAEALIRWDHPEKGILSPAAFLPVAEAGGLMLNVANFCIDDALRQKKEWEARDFNMRISMNLSPSVLRDAEVSEIISVLLDKWQVHPSGFDVEITENALVKDPVQATAVLSLIQALGVALSLDDFGTGYSSLSNLREIPFQEIKVDKSFVTSMLDETGDAAIVHALIDLGHALGRKVVAEGIEDLPTLRRLREWGCDFAQGYFISRPIPPDAFEDFVKKRKM